MTRYGLLALVMAVVWGTCYLLVPKKKRKRGWAAPAIALIFAGVVLMMVGKPTTPPKVTVVGNCDATAVGNGNSVEASCSQ